jgi:hypothetical protein
MAEIQPNEKGQWAKLADRPTPVGAFVMRGV